MSLLSMIIVVLALFFGFSVFFHDFVYNANYQSELLDEYAPYVDLRGVRVAEAPHTIQADWLKSWRYDWSFAVARYDTRTSLIKFNPGEEWAIPHEIGHHVWEKQMSEMQREEFCDFSDWQWMSYKYGDEGNSTAACEEGFAELFGEQLEMVVKEGEK